MSIIGTFVEEWRAQQLLLAGANWRKGIGKLLLQMWYCQPYGRALGCLCMQMGVRVSHKQGFKEWQPQTGLTTHWQPPFVALPSRLTQLKYVSQGERCIDLLIHICDMLAKREVQKQCNFPPVMGIIKIIPLLLPFRKLIFQIYFK